jgi:hypothetical protein
MKERQTLGPDGEPRSQGEGQQAREESPSKCTAAEQKRHNDFYERIGRQARQNGNDRRVGGKFETALPDWRLR